MGIYSGSWKGNCTPFMAEAKIADLMRRDGGTYVQGRPQRGAGLHAVEKLESWGLVGIYLEEPA